MARLSTVEEVVGDEKAIERVGLVGVTKDGVGTCKNKEQLRLSMLLLLLFESGIRTELNFKW